MPKIIGVSYHIPRRLRGLLLCSRGLEMSSDIYAFLVRQPDGTERIAQCETGAGWAAMVATDLEVVEAFRKAARHQARSGKQVIRLVRFSNPEAIEVFKP